MVSVWYPAIMESGKIPGRYVEPLVDRDLERVRAGMDRLPYVVTYALPEARCASDNAPYPIVLFSPGVTALRSQAAEKGPELASHGYVVVGVDHWDALGTVFPDGTHVQNPTSADMTVPGFQDRVKDLIFVLDELARWNSTDPVFAGRLDVTNVAAMGFSWGGEVAPEVCRIDTRVRVAVMLDSYPSVAPVCAYDLIALGLSKPFIGMYSAGGGDSTLFNKATKDAIHFTITGSQHLNFGDYYWISFPGDLVGGKEIARTINAYTLWFLNKYLKGLDEPMPNRADYPRVTNFRQK
jgi:hypothetical protein